MFEKAIRWPLSLSSFYKPAGASHSGFGGIKEVMSYESK